MNYKDQYQCPKTFPWRYADILCSDTCVLAVEFSNQYYQPHKNEITELCKQQLNAYFTHQLTEFTLPLLAQFPTNFSTSVWSELIKVPYGKIVSYQQVAISLGDKNKARAVGRACSINPVSIIVPCHRIVGSAGKLTGYAGGLATKEWLLAHENR